MENGCSLGLMSKENAYAIIIMLSIMDETGWNFCEWVGVGSQHFLKTSHIWIEIELKTIYLPKKTMDGDHLNSKANIKEVATTKK